MNEEEEEEEVQFHFKKEHEKLGYQVKAQTLDSYTIKPRQYQNLQNKNWKMLFLSFSQMMNWKESLMIISTFKDNTKILYADLSKNLSSQNQEKLSKIQSKLLDIAKKQTHKTIYK
jgi:hypothetical protein